MQRISLLTLDDDYRSSVTSHLKNKPQQSRSFPSPQTPQPHSRVPLVLGARSVSTPQGLTGELPAHPHKNKKRGGVPSFALKPSPLLRFANRSPAPKSKREWWVEHGGIGERPLSVSGLATWCPPMGGWWSSGNKKFDFKFHQLAIAFPPSHPRGPPETFVGA